MNCLSHIAIIMDGNGRWALQRSKNRNFGHKQGLKNINPIINFCKIKKIKFLTLFVFSIDNWKRSKDEVSYLFELLEVFLKKHEKDLIKDKIRVNFIGEKKGLSKTFLKKIKKIEEKTSINYEITVNIAFNYSSQMEIVSAVKEIVKRKEKRITTQVISEQLYTKKTPDPEILIRTGGLSRISNFLLWQISYTEIFFIKKLWPDFTVSDLNKIFLKYSKIKRNFGNAN
jgi:undecaprenyl diphosphate synthase